MPLPKSGPKTKRTDPETESTTEPKAKAKTEKPKTSRTVKGKGKEAKADPPPAPRAFRELVLSEPWMKPWADIAVATGSAARACAEVGISIADFVAARDRDAAFDTICRTYAEVVDLRVIDNLCLGAIGGDARSVSMYFSHVRELLFHTGTKAFDSTLSANVVEAMIRVGLSTATLPPALKTSRLGAKLDSDSGEDSEDE